MHRLGRDFLLTATRPDGSKSTLILIERWGEQTTDEMCIGFLNYTRDDEHLGGPPRRRYAPLVDWRP